MNRMPAARLALWLLTCSLLGHAAGVNAQQDAVAGASPTRPRVGLVLSGGGARGLAHVGVLKVLERAGIPVDAIAGTSMGAIVGGLYASGMGADELERELLAVDWAAVFASRVDRQHLSQRRKEEDFEISPVIELGIRDGELRTPLAAVSSRGLESLLRRYTLPVRAVSDFDRLPIPFRAVATDLETGAPVVLARGDLALALRSSMSVPGVFSPTEVDGRLLGDGGLVDNVPIDVARAMGVDALIVVNIGTPLAGREAMQSAVGVTTQMINILTEQNVQRSLATLGARDVLVSPDLGKLTSADFDQSRVLVALGERGAQAALPRLRAYAVEPHVYAQWRSQHPSLRNPQATISFVAFEGSTLTNPQRFEAQLESQPGQVFDAARAERDARTLAASGDYMRADYQLVSSPGGDGLVFDLDDKTWGPNYLRIGLDMSTEFNGRSSFNLKLSHNRHWLTSNGTEWRNRIQIGSAPAWFSELYHPLNWTVGLSNDWFVAAYASAEQRGGVLYGDGGDELARYDRSTSRGGIDLGQPWGRFGELRLGLNVQTVRIEPTLVSGVLGHSTPPVRYSEAGLRLAAVVDQLDFANFPQRGYRLVGEAALGVGRDAGRYQRLEASAMLVGSVGRHTINWFGLARGASQPRSPSAIGRYALGGFHLLSGYRDDQLLGNYVLLSRLTWYLRLADVPVLTRGLFVGATAEAGNAWSTRDALQDGSLRTGMSLFVGADTGLGPLYLALTHAPRGGTGIVLFIGRP